MPINLNDSAEACVCPGHPERQLATILGGRPRAYAFGLRSWAQALAVVALSACASLDTGTPQTQITKRATERWQALIALDFARAYTYGTPSFRAVVPQDNYRIRFGAGVTWLGAEVMGVECPDTTKCIAKIRIDYKTLLGRNSGAKYSAQVDETWLYDAGQWWIFESVKP